MTRNMKKAIAVLGIIFGLLLALLVLASSLEEFPRLFSPGQGFGFVYLGGYVFTYFVMFVLSIRLVRGCWKIIKGTKE